MKNKIRISILGSGNMAKHFGAALKKAGLDISQVYSRNHSNGLELSKKLKARFFERIQDLDDTDYYFLAVVDDAIEDVSKKLANRKGTIVHFSGNKDLDFSDHPNLGVLWPIFSINPLTKKSWKNVPVVINGSSSKIKQQLKDISDKLGASSHILNDDQKKIAHLAAVFANNFSAHMINTSKEVLRNAKLDESLVSAIINQTSRSMKKANRIPQTGPAKRGDEKVMGDHLKILESHPNLRSMYKAISKSINEK